MTEIEEQEQRVKTAMKDHSGENGFPLLSDYDTTEEEVSDYFFDLRVAPDLQQDAKKRYTIYSIILIMPVVVLSAFANGTKWLLLGVGTGLVLCGIYYCGTRMWDNYQERKRMASAPARYIAAVEAFLNKR